MKWLALPLAVVLLYLAVRSVDPAEVLTTATRANPWWMVAVWLSMTASQFARSVRWRILLRAQGPISYPDAFWATTAGYVGNNVLPARAGEVIRTALAARASGLPASFIFATAMVERVMDVPTLVAAALVASLFTGALAPVFEQALGVMALAALGGVLFLLAAPSATRPISWVLGRIPLGAQARERIGEQLGRLLLGFETLRQPRRVVPFLAMTVVVWSNDIVTCLLLAQALGLSMTVPMVILLLAGLGLSSALPSTPGFVGIYQFVAVTVLTRFDFTPSAAIAYIVLLQTMIYAVVLPWGLSGMWLLGRRGHADQSLGKIMANH
ncbi:MAG: flippase-like domain-containing protein [Chloroflexota bacterium]|nr:MAG: flippase-like domain-containing protein [Chloroflexota bacterium]